MQVCVYTCLYVGHRVYHPSGSSHPHSASLCPVTAPSHCTTRSGYRKVPPGSEGLGCRMRLMWSCTISLSEPFARFSSIKSLHVCLGHSHLVAWGFLAVSTVYSAFHDLEDSLLWRSQAQPRWWVCVSFFLESWRGKSLSVFFPFLSLSCEHTHQAGMHPSKR